MRERPTRVEVKRTGSGRLPDTREWTLWYQPLPLSSPHNMQLPQFDIILVHFSWPEQSAASAECLCQRSQW